MKNVLCIFYGACKFANVFLARNVGIYLIAVVITAQQYEYISIGFIWFKEHERSWLCGRFKRLIKKYDVLLLCVCSNLTVIIPS